MKPNLTPLNALRAFEAVSRHRSFSKAAEELLVTQGAISRQVKKLEDALQMKLLQRTHPQLSLTESGERLFHPLSAAFASIDQTIAMMASKRGVLRLQVAPTFAIRWLMPRISSFAADSKSLDVRITTALRYHEFDTHSFDAGILYGNGSWPGMRALCLSLECLTPVCSPNLHLGTNPIRTISDLRHHTLLHTTTVDNRDWRLWLEAVGSREIDWRQGPAFETLDLSVRAAEAGFGVSIGDLSLIADDIHEGRLVAPFEQKLMSGRGIYFVYPIRSERNSGVIEFSEWLKANSPIAKGVSPDFVTPASTIVQPSR